jgi:hypothetical protein
MNLMHPGLLMLSGEEENVNIASFISETTWRYCNEI